MNANEFRYLAIKRICCDAEVNERVRLALGPLWFDFPTSEKQYDEYTDRGIAVSGLTEKDFPPEQTQPVPGGYRES